MIRIDFSSVRGNNKRSNIHKLVYIYTYISRIQFNGTVKISLYIVNDTLIVLYLQ